MSKRQYQRFLTVSFLAIFLLNACAPLAAPKPTPVTGVRFEPTDCMFGDVKGVDCGYLYVPEDRSQAQGPEIRLAVAIIRTSNPNPAPDPVLVLHNWIAGPGAHTVGNTTSFMVGLKQFLTDRDVVLFDQRGIGFSSPSLECPEVGRQVLQDAPQDFSQEELQRHLFQAYRVCHDRLEEEGIDLSVYTEAADAADINDLRMALGYTEWNLYADAYGSRVALRMMRDFPGGIRSVIIDSVYPLEVNVDAEAGVNIERALKLIFEGCAADESCNNAYPDLEDIFYAAAAQLDADPIPLELANPDTRQKVTMLVNGDRMIDMMVFLLGSTDALPYIPKWIYKFYEGDPGGDYMLVGYLSIYPFLHEYSSGGMGLSIQCNAEGNGSSARLGDVENEIVTPRLEQAVNQGRYLDLCPAWDIEPVAEIEIQPAAGDIPTLLLAGDNDPISPPTWSTSVAQNLGNSYFFGLPWASFNTSYGGGSAANRCAWLIINAFIADPAAKPDSACIDHLAVSFSTH